jgi:hypothetical protein
MAKYYAIVCDNYIRVGINTGQLEIYETKKQAKENCKRGNRVIKVKVGRAKRLYVGMPVDMTKPEWWDDE